ncbi:uncharacterized protein LOC127252132 [Andrographis paniculata]|uniref:uncharacterized protein LOC127252132 n=1 Tax=Andrographis paniculata TaxID=175694 RepID=UPI0021E94D99|nr:uncharacterized protein LOC127252132 [Andrographis paniculata]
MSVFGGDSWAREAQYRKRRVDDLMIEGIEAASYKKLPSGKFACLICPKNPVLDTPIMLATHRRGSSHRANELRHKDRKNFIREEASKKLAMSNCAETNANSSSSNSTKIQKTNIRPLIERARGAATEVISGAVSRPEVKSGASSLVLPCRGDFGCNGNSIEGEPTSVVPPLDCRKHREMELKFTAAGWKRDCHGKWFKDENVEFDSDEEDPNIVFKNNT